MRSHRYDFQLQDLARVIGPPLVAMSLFAALAHGLAALRVLPPPRPTLDTDRTILVHQVEASRSPQAAEVVLIGDSSCLMDVSALELGRRLGHPALNLGTLSYLDLNAYAALVQEYARANPGRLRVLVLLLHPEALRRASPESYYVGLLQDLLKQKVASANGDYLHGEAVGLLGLGYVRDCCLARVLPVPLTGAFGRRYGFTTDLDKYLKLHGGSLVEPETKRSFRGNAEYRLAASLQKASRAFRAAVPPGCKLVAGITPAPVEFVRPIYRQDYAVMLEQWSQWLRADAALRGLPATLPGRYFAKTTHLNEGGMAVYTSLVASNLAGLDLLDVLKIEN
jgi:hypothetical protein